MQQTCEDIATEGPRPRLPHWTYRYQQRNALGSARASWPCRLFITILVGSEQPRGYNVNQSNPCKLSGLSFYPIKLYA